MSIIRYTQKNLSTTYDMKSATDISRDVSHQKKYPISDSQESQGVHVTFLRDLWITFPF